MSGAQLPTRLNRNREQKVHQNCHRKLQHKFFQKKKKKSVLELYEYRTVATNDYRILSALQIK